MKKQFTSPTLELIRVEDTIRTSGQGGSLSVGSDDDGKNWGALIPLWR